MRDKFYPPIMFLRPTWSAFLIAFIVLSGCSVLDQIAPATEPPAPTVAVVPPTSAPIVIEPTVEPPTATAIPPTNPPPAPTDSPEPPPTETATAVATVNTAGIADSLYIEAGQLNLYPPGAIYAGDQVTFQLAVSIPDGVPVSQVFVEVDLNGERLAVQPLNSGNLGREKTLILPQIWNTTGQAGTHQLTFTADPLDLIQAGDENPNNNSMTFEVTVLPATTLFPSDASWISRETDHTRIHVVAGTAAARDLEKLAIVTEESVQIAIANLRQEPRRKYDVYFIERVIGQGGYAGGSMVISYTDRNYSGGRIEEVITHETIHLLDQQISPSNRLTFLAEGLAVWGSGGHYKPEDLNERAAALVATGRYIPLNQIIDNFYPVQHEIGYLEAGAFVQYLIDTYGWEKFETLYSRFQAGNDGRDAERLDDFLQIEYGKSMEQIEQEWLTSLDSISLDRNVVADLNGTIRFYNIMRKYQSIHDPTAYFLEAWLPSPNSLREKGLTAELTRHPEAEINLVLEVMLTEAEILLRSGNFRQAEVLMGSIERALDNQNTFIDPLGASYNDITLAAYARGFEVQRVLLDGQNAIAVYTVNNGSELFTLEFARERENWVVVQ